MDGKTFVNLLEKKKGGSPMESPSLRRLTTTVQPTIKEKDDFTQQQDDDYAYVILKNK